MADVSITANNVAPGTGALTEQMVAGATITAGQVVYKDTSDSDKAKLADSNSATALARSPYGIALNGAASGQPVVVLKAGLITIGGTVAVGTIYVLSGTAGGIAPSTDLASGMYTSIIGIATTAAILSVAIREGGVAVP